MELLVGEPEYLCFQSDVTSCSGGVWRVAARDECIYFSRLMGIDLLRSSTKRWTLWDCGRARPTRQRGSSHLTNEVKNTPAPRCGKVNRGLLLLVKIKTGPLCEMRRASPQSLIKVRLMTGVESRRREIHTEQKTYPFSFLYANPDSTYEWAGEVRADQGVDVTCAVWLRRPQERPHARRRCTNSDRNSSESCRQALWLAQRES